MTSRRHLILATAATSTLVVTRPSRGQPAERKLRIGVLASSAAVLKDPHWVGFFHRLGELGLVDGRNVSIDLRHADNKLDRLPALAKELAALRCDIFFAGGSAANLAALTAASSTTPIISSSSPSTSIPSPAGTWPACRARAAASRA